MLDSVDRTALRRRFRERLLAPSDDGYESLRLVDNGAIDQRPAVIARAVNPADVAAVLAVARTSGLPLAVRSGGHSAAGHSTGDGAIVLDLSLMTRMDIDAAARTAWVGAGILAGDYTRAAYARGLATPFGDTGSVGVGGLTLGGGVGWLVRKHGLTIDSLLAVELMLASGEVVVASPDENLDLFWAVRGGGGNFGVATRFKMLLHPIGTVLHGTIVMPATAEVLGGLVRIGLAAPDELTIMVAILPAPPIEEISVEHHGKLVVFIEFVWAGSSDQAIGAIEPLRALARPIFEETEETPYPDVYPDKPSNHDPWTSRAIFLPGFDGETVDIINRGMAAAASESALLHLRILGGAAARVPNDATAFGWRDQSLLLWIIADFAGRPASELPVHERWAEDLRAQLATKGAGTYVNFMGDEGPGAVRSAYPGTTWERLRAVKSRYDPENLFRRNQNVPPSN